MARQFSNFFTLEISQPQDFFPSHTIQKITIFYQQ